MTAKCNHCGGNHLANHKSQACHDHYKKRAEKAESHNRRLETEITKLKAEREGLQMTIRSLRMRGEDNVE